MDLDDLDDARSQVPSRLSRFAPKSSKLKPRPRAEPKSELQPALPKSELQRPVERQEQDSDVLIEKRKEDGEETVEPKAEHAATNGAVKMDVDLKSEVEKEHNMDDLMEEDNDEDMVVREIDVFFTPKVDANTQLYVIQYPLRPCWRPYELDERCQEVRVKRGSEEVEVDLVIDVDSKNYDGNSGTRMNMTKQTLASNWNPPRVTAGQAVGVLMGNKLHLNPVHAVVQLRPSREHLNPNVPKRKSNVKGDADVKPEELSEERSVVSSRKQNKQIDSSTEMETDDGECWIPLKYHGSKSDLSFRYLQRMLAQDNAPIKFTMNPYDYVVSISPEMSTKYMQPIWPSRRYLLSLPLEDRIKKLLTKGPPVCSSSALTNFVPDYGMEEFLEVLQRHAQLVQGFWAPKSTLLFPDDGAECLARDFTLLLLSKNPVVSYSQLNIHKSLRDKVKRFLNVLAVERPLCKDWKFKERTDMSFIRLHPQVVREQEKIWEQAEEKINSHIRNRGERSGPSAKTVTSKPNMISKPMNPDKGGTKSSSGTVRGKITMSDETREALPKALQKLLQIHKVCSFQLICQGLRDLAVSQSSLPKADPRMVAAAYGADAPPDELKKIISSVATEIHGLYVLTSSPEHPEYDPLRKVVIELLRGNGPKSMLKKADVMQAAQIKLGRDITNNEYSKVMTDICVSRGSAWLLKGGDGNLK